jgi:hypothetical protein
MYAIGIFAVAVGIVCFILIAAISLRGPRGGGRRLSGNHGAMVPYDSDGDGDADGGSK